MMEDIPLYPGPIYRHPPKPTRIPASEGQENIDINPEINIDFEENSISRKSICRDIPKTQ